MGKVRLSIHASLFLRSMRQMKRLRKLVAIVLITLLVLVGILAGALFLLSDKIKDKLITEINSQLVAKVEVGSVGLSVLDHFPQLSLSFTDLKIHESTAVNDSALAVLDQVSLTMNLFNILKQNIVVDGLEIRGGYLSLALDEAGNENYLIFKSSSDTVEEQSPLSFTKIRIRNTHVVYRNIKDIIQLEIPELVCSGDFRSEKFTAKIEGKSLTSFSNPDIVLAPRQIVYNSELMVDNSKELIHFDNTFLGLGDLQFELNGKWYFSDLGGEIQINSKGAEIKKLLSLLPADYLSYLEQYESSGVLNFQGNLRKKQKEAPVLRADFTIEKGSLFLKEYSEGLNNIQLRGDLLLSEKTQVLHISRFESRLDKDLIKGTLRLDDLSDPVIHSVIMGEFGLENLKRVAQLGQYNQSSGNINLNLNLQAKISELKDPTKYRNIKLEGKLKGSNLNIAGDSIPEFLREAQVFVEFKARHCKIHRLEALWKNEKIQLQGEANNYLAYLFNEEDLEIKGSLQADRLDLSEELTKSEQTTMDTAALQLPPRVFVDAELRIGELLVNNFKATQILGRALLGGNRMRVSKLSLETSGGKLQVAGDWSRRADSKQMVSLEGQFQDINIQEAFRQFNNFGQKEIVYDHIKGTLSGKIEAGMLLDAFFNPIMPSIVAYVDFVILGGELNNFTPLQSLSKFVRIQDLEHIRFDRLENQFEIRNEVINIPSMLVKNSALNLILEGRHHFNNTLDYSVQLQLKELLAARYMRDHQQDEFEEEEKGVNVYLRMSGTPDNLQIRYDSRKARKGLKKEIKKEREVVRDLIRKEFGLPEKGKKDKKTTDKQEDVPNWEDDIPE